jgi:hypothetical protein
MKDRSHISSPVRIALDKQNPEIKRRVLAEAARAASRSGRTGTPAKVIVKPVRRIGPSRASES